MTPRKESNPIDDLRAAREAAARINTTERTLRERHVALTEEIRQITLAPPSLEEVLEQIDRAVDDAVASFRENHEYTFLDAVSGRSSEQEGGRRAVAPQLPRLYSVSGIDTVGFAQLAALMPDGTKALLHEWARTSERVRWGMPRAARQARLEELREEQARVREQHTDLVDAANAEGISLALLQDVRQERDAAERERGRQQELERQRALLAGQEAAGLITPAVTVQHARMYPDR